MFKSHLKSFLSILIVGILILPWINGCAKKETVEAPKSDEQQNVIGGEEEKEKKVKEEEKEEEKDSPKSMYPIVDKPLTLKYWVQMHANAAQYIRSYNENEVYQEMEKITGIHIDFIHPAAGQIKEQFNIMIASDDLPDIIGNAGNYTGGEFKGVDDGVFVNLTPYLEENAPDYYKLINSDAEIKREVTREDGTVAAFYRIKPEADPPWRRVILREDWLNELGLEIPRTIEDYEKMFEVLKEQKGVVPYILAQNGMEEQFTGPFGVLPGFYLKDGKVAFGQMQPEFKEYLALMNKWYEAGYIHKDSPALQEQQAQEMFLSGQVGMVIMSIDSSFNKAQEVNIDITPAPFPRLKLGDKLHSGPAHWPVGGDVTVVASTSKYIEEAIKWLNYAYTEEGSRLFNYGVQGKSWILGEDGKPKFTDYVLNNPNGLSTTHVNYILKVHFAPKLCDTDVNCLPNIFKHPNAREMRMKWSDDSDVDSALRIPPIRLTKEELDKRSKIMTEVNTYSDEMVLKFIIGAEPLENFDKYVEQLKNLGIEEAIAITQAAYDRYISQ